MTDARRPPPDPVLAAIGSNIRAEMSRKGISQAEVARVIGCSQAQVSERIRGYVAVGAKELLQIGDLLGVSVEQLTAISPAATS